MSVLETYDYSFPVVGGILQPTDTRDLIEIKQVHGTAFYIGGNTFITAGHVLKGVIKNPWYGIGYIEKGEFIDRIPWKVERIFSYEIIEDWDIAFFRSIAPTAKALSWETSELPMLANVASCGYPFAFDPERVMINIRCFRGYIVSQPKFYLLNANPRIYELSFQCFRGISGAPLISDSPLKITGIIIGNQKSQIMVFSNKESLQEGDKETIVEQYEAFNIGVAIQSRALFEIKSELLGKTLKEHLQDNGLL
jgi:hypothetical protein